MKSVVLALVLAFSLVPAFGEAEKTKVCVDVKDKAGQPVKDAKGNVQQRCKEMKVHKKLEGTDIPAKK